jgi:hypothetical protein
VIAFLLMLVASVHAAPHAALFVGNSFTQYNDPFALDQSYAALVAEGQPEWDPLTVDRWTRGGATLSMHLEAATEGGLELLLTGDSASAYERIVLQDQSQIPGFPESHSQWVESRDAAVSLAGIIDSVGAQTQLFMTWGKRDGDPIDPERFPDYSTMQENIEAGYTAYAAAIEAAGYAVEIVPVGLAWQVIFTDHIDAGEDPLDSGALFARLYAGDGSHPSRLGTYLAACVFYAANTGSSPEGLNWAPDTITEADRDALQAIAARVVAPAATPGDTGTPPLDSGTASTDTGGDGDGSGDEPSDDGGGAHTGTPLGDSGGDTASGDDSGGTQKGSGCGCISLGASHSSTWTIGWLLAVVGLRRRATHSASAPSRF